jgi:glycosyltransferase involved in cell wall biosynthesis
MRILFLTFNYPPDLSAGSFRAKALVEQLAKRLPPGSRIDVLTTRPNRYASIEIAAPDHEELGSLAVERIPLPAHKGGMLDRARAFLAFDLGVIRSIRGRKYDLVFATSSRLMTAVLGARAADKLGAPLYLDIRDLFVDAIGEVLPGVKGRLLLPIFSRLEGYAVRRAAKVNLVSAGFKPYFDERYPATPLDFFTNGIDDEFLTRSWPAGAAVSGRPIRVLYAGNIGSGQGLHRVLPRLAKLAGPGYQFVVIGDGGCKDELVRELAREEAGNVEIRTPVKRSELIPMYEDADVLFLHLEDYAICTKVLPSKLFEYAATGKPLLAGVAGFPAEFLRQEVKNCGVFHPCDADAGLAALKGLTLGATDRADFIRRFARTAIMERMAGAVLKAGAA